MVPPTEFALNPPHPQAVLAGDHLLIHGAGCGDFQNGDPEKSRGSIAPKICTLPIAKAVCLAHHSEGWTASSVGEQNVATVAWQESSAVRT